MRHVTSQELRDLWQNAAETRARAHALVRETAELRAATSERRIVQYDGGGDRVVPQIAPTGKPDAPPS